MERRGLLAHADVIRSQLGDDDISSVNIDGKKLTLVILNSMLPLIYEIQDKELARSLEEEVEEFISNFRA